MYPRVKHINIIFILIKKDFIFLIIKMYLKNVFKIVTFYYLKNMYNFNIKMTSCEFFINFNKIKKY